MCAGFLKVLQSFSLDTQSPLPPPVEAQYWQYFPSFQITQERDRKSLATRPVDWWIQIVVIISVSHCQYAQRSGERYSGERQHGTMNAEQNHQISIHQYYLQHSWCHFLLARQWSKYTVNAVKAVSSWRETQSWITPLPEPGPQHFGSSVGSSWERTE